MLDISIGTSSSYLKSKMDYTVCLDYNEFNQHDDVFNAIQSYYRFIHSHKHKDTILLQLPDTQHLNKINTTFRNCIRYLELDNTFNLEQGSIDDFILIEGQETTLEKINKVYVYIHKKNHPETKYIQILNDIVYYGMERNNERTGVGTKSIFDIELSIDLSFDYFPVQDVRKTPKKTIWREVLWYLSGSTDVNELHKHNIHVWDGNTNRTFLDENGLKHFDEYDIGATYGYQIRHSGFPYQGKQYDYTNKGYDQWQNLVQQIIQYPESRRHIINLYIPHQLKEMALPPCMMLYQFYLTRVKNQENMFYLDSIFYSRSSDIFLAGYWNMCQATILMHLLKDEVNKKTNGCMILKPRHLSWKIGDAHIYNHQINTVKECIKKSPRYYYRLKCIDEQTGPVITDDYHPQTTLSSKMAV